MKLDVSHIAKLANLPLTEEEKKKFDTQLSETLKYIEGLEEIDTKEITPTNHLTGLRNVMREDIAIESLTQEAAVSNSKFEDKGFFKVKAILEND